MVAKIHPGYRCMVALGGNVGDVAATFRNATLQMAALGLRPLALSRLYRSKALLWPNSPPQPDYLNAACLVETDLAPHQVLRALHALEAQAGLRAAGRWRARTLDLDFVSCKNLYLNDAALILPHPRAHQRDFVLRPVSDIDPLWPLNRRGDGSGALLAKLAPDQQFVLASRLSWLRGGWD